MDGISIGNNNIKVADVLPRSFEKKTKSALGLPLIGESGEDSMVANGVEDGDGMKGRSARTVVTPLAHMPYADQLEQKKSSVTQILKKLVSELVFILCYADSYYHLCPCTLPTEADF